MPTRLEDELDAILARPDGFGALGLPEDGDLLDQLDAVLAAPDMAPVGPPSREVLPPIEGVRPGAPAPRAGRREGLGAAVADWATGGWAREAPTAGVSRLAGVPDEPPRGLVETAKEKRYGEAIPLLGTLAKAGRMSQVRDALRDLKAYSEGDRGAFETLTGPGAAIARVFQGGRPAQRHRYDPGVALRIVTEYMAELDEAQRRGQTIPAQIYEGVVDLLPYAVEFYLTGLPAGAVTRATVGKVGVAALRKYGTTAARRTLIKMGARGAGWVATAAMRTALQPARMLAGQAEREIAGQTPTQALWNAVSDVMIENLSEVTGEVLVKGAMRGVRRIPGIGKLAGKLDDGLRKAWAKMGKAPKQFDDVLAKLGYDGIVGEIGEERLGGVMRGAIGQDDMTVFDAIPSGRQLLVEAGIFAVPMLPGTVTGVVATLKEDQRDRLAKVTDPTRANVAKALDVDPGYLPRALGTAEGREAAVGTARVAETVAEREREAAPEGVEPPVTGVREPEVAPELPAAAREQEGAMPTLPPRRVRIGQLRAEGLDADAAADQVKGEQDALGEWIAAHTQEGDLLDAREQGMYRRIGDEWVPIDRATGDERRGAVAVPHRDMAGARPAGTWTDRYGAEARPAPRPEPAPPAVPGTITILGHEYDVESPGAQDAAFRNYLIGAKQMGNRMSMRDIERSYHVEKGIVTAQAVGEYLAAHGVTVEGGPAPVATAAPAAPAIDWDRLADLVAQEAEAEVAYRAAVAGAPLPERDALEARFHELEKESFEAWVPLYEIDAELADELRRLTHDLAIDRPGVAQMEPDLRASMEARRDAIMGELTAKLAPARPKGPARVAQLPMGEWEVAGTPGLTFRTRAAAEQAAELPEAEAWTLHHRQYGEYAEGPVEQIIRAKLVNNHPLTADEQAFVEEQRRRVAAARAARPPAAPTADAILREHAALKKVRPGVLIAMRVGDFYEFFGEDAKVVAEVCGLTLTARADVPLAGFPYHSLEGHLKALIAAGHKVAIAEPRGEAAPVEERPEPQPPREEAPRGRPPTEAADVRLRELDPTRWRDARRLVDRHRAETDRLAKSVARREVAWRRAIAAIARDEGVPVEEVRRLLDVAYENTAEPIIVDEAATFYAYSDESRPKVAALAERARQMKPRPPVKPQAEGVRRRKRVRRPRAAKTDAAMRLAMSKATTRRPGDYASGRKATHAVKITDTEAAVTDGARMWLLRRSIGKPGVYVIGKKGKIEHVVDEADTPFPASYAEALPESKPITTVDIEEALNNLRRVAMMATPEYPGVVVIINRDESLGFATMDPEIGTGEVHIGYGFRILGAVNAKFLREQLEWHAKAGDTGVRLTWDEPGAVLLTEGDGGETAAALLPLKAEGEAPEFATYITMARAAGRARRAPPAEAAPGEVSAFAYQYQGEPPGPGTPHPSPVERNTAEPSIFQMPELVLLAKELLAGKYPRLARRLAAGPGRRAQAVFRPKEPAGEIALKASIFIGPEITSVAAVPNQAEAVAERLQRTAIERFGLTDADLHVTMERKGNRTIVTLYRIDPDYAAKALAHEVGHLADWLPEHVRARGNILGRIASLTKYLKTMLEGTPDSQAELLTPRDRGRLRRRAARAAKAELGEDAEAAALKERTSTLYAAAVQAEAESRGLYTRADIMAELKALTTWWSPFDPEANPKYTAYRFRPSELYAEAISVLLNNPAALRERAPKFYAAFFAYFDRKPAVRRVYDRINAEIQAGGDALHRRRDRRLRASFERADAKYAVTTRRRGLARDASLAARTLFLDVHAATKGRAAKLRRAGRLPPEADPEYAIERATYSGSEHEGYLADIRYRVRATLLDAGLDWQDLDVYMFHLRVVHERKLIANPQGFNPRTSQDFLDHMRQQLGEARWAALERARREFWAIRQTYIVAKAHEAGVFSPELMAKIADNEYYATFDVQHYIEDAYGPGTGVHIYRQIGTLEEVAGPATATLMRDLSLTRAINWNKAKRATVDMLLAEYPQDIQEAETRWRVDHREFVPPTDKDQRLLMFLDRGKLLGYYVPTWVAQGFDRRDYKAMRIGSAIARAIGAPFRLLFTGIRPGFWMFNIVRDFRRAVKNAPKAGYVTFARHWLRAVAPAFRSTFAIPDATVAEMMHGNMLVSVADIAGLTEEDKQVERLIAMYAHAPTRWFESWRAPFIRMFHTLLRVGEAIERVPKIAGYTFLQETFPDMSREELAHLVRTQVGSPAFLTKGAATPITNNLFLFSNAFLQAVRSDIEVWRDRPGELAWKSAKYVLLPKALMWALSAGVLGWLLRQAGMGDDDEAVQWADAMQRMLVQIPEYDKTNYFTIPLGVTPQGKTVYLRVPMDEQERLLGGMFWKAMQTPANGLRTLPQTLDFAADQLPSLNPAFVIGAASLDYLAGNNPYDSFRGRHVLPDNLFRARSFKTHLAFAGWMANQSGASIIYRFRHDDPGRVRGELEKVLGLAVMSDVVGRFVKVSDRGEYELYRDAAVQEQRRRAREIERLKLLIVRYREGKPLSDEERALLWRNRRYARQRMQRDRAWQAGAYEAALQGGGSRREQQAIRERHRERTAP